VHAIRTVTHSIAINDLKGKSVTTAISATINNKGEITGYSKMEITEQTVTSFEPSGLEIQETTKTFVNFEVSEADLALIKPHAKTVSDQVHTNSNYVRDKISKQNSETTGNTLIVIGGFVGVRGRWLAAKAKSAAVLTPPTLNGFRLTAEGVGMVTTAIGTGTAVIGGYWRTTTWSSAEGYYDVIAPNSYKIE
jgi:hypothetical protein